MKPILYLFICLCLMASCNPDTQECYVPKSVTVQVGFVIIDTVIGKDSLLRDSIYVRTADTALNYPSLLSIGVDSVIKFQGAFRVSQLPVMLNPATPSISYRFQPDSTQAAYDTLRFYYTPKYHFISNACGYTYYYNIDSVSTTKHLLDASAVKNREVTESAQNRHVEFYFID